MMAKANKITEHQFLAGSQKARTLSRQAADISATTPILSLPTTPQADPLFRNDIKD